MTNTTSTVVADLIGRSNRLGSDPKNTNYAGGNTSAKGSEVDPVTGEPVELLWVKGSGGDLGSIKRFRRWAIITVEKNRHGLGQVELEVQKDFEHGRFYPQVQVINERLIEERVFTT